MDRQFDFLVIGSGIAGLSFALKCAPLGSVALITKAHSEDGSTNRAQGGIASAVEATDSVESHIADTLEAGAGLCRVEAVRTLAENGPEIIRQLIDWGVRFTRQRVNPQETYPYHLALEGGHSHRRILHADDLTGAEVMRALLEEVKKFPSVRLFESHTAIDLLREGDGEGRCCGALVLDRATGEAERVLSKVTVLATGGAGQVFLHTTNHEVSSGDGIAMAWRAGADCADMEFMQFHPTSLAIPGADNFLISEAVRGHGGILRNQLGEAFMANEHPRKDLAPRDIVARAIDRQMRLHGLDNVWLDVTHIGDRDLRFFFPNIYRECRKYGVEIEKTPIPVVPAAHYMCGGVMVDTNSETSIPGLYACGETSCTGVHGANRLASNSLLESVVFALRAAEDAKRYLAMPAPKAPEARPLRRFSPMGAEWKDEELELRTLMWKKVGIVRNDADLADAALEIEALRTRVDIAWKSSPVINLRLSRLRNLSQVAALLVEAARLRHESRGLHYSTDWPEKAPVAEHIVLARGKEPRREV